MSPGVPAIDPLAIAPYAGRPIPADGARLEASQWRAIEHLIFSYSYNWDSRQPGATAELFTDDAEICFFLDGADEPTHRTIGSELLFEEMTARTEMLKRWRIETRHLMTMNVVGPQDDGATQVMTTAVIYWQQLPDHPQPVAVQTGYYKSWCVETGAGWRFQRRETHLSGLFHPRQIYG